MEIKKITKKKAKELLELHKKHLPFPLDLTEEEQIGLTEKQKEELFWEGEFSPFLSKFGTTDNGDLNLTNYFLYKILEELKKKND